MKAPKAGWTTDSSSNVSDPSGHSAQINDQSQLSLGTAVRRYPRIVVYSLAICSCATFYGYDLVISGTVPALPAFQIAFGQPFEQSYIIPSVWLSLFSAIPPFGAIIGSLLGGCAQDKIGRRCTFALSVLLSSVAVAMMFVCDSPDSIDGRRGFFLVAKTTLGLALASLQITTQTYVSEITPACLRPSIIATLPAFTLAGQLIGSAIAAVLSNDLTRAAYRKAFASQWAFNVLPCVIAFFLPESPTYLLRKDRVEAALSSYKRLIRDPTQLQLEFDSARASIATEHKAAGQVRYFDLFRGTNRRRTFITMFAGMIPSLFGIPLLAMASYFLQLLGMNARLSLIILIVGIVLGLVGNVSAVWLLSKVGRRRISLVTLSISTVLYVVMGVSGLWSGTPTMWITAAVVMGVFLICSVGVWPAALAIASEASSLRLRSKSLGAMGLSSNISTIMFNLVLPYIFSPDAGNLKAKTGFFYAAVCGLTTVVWWFVMPEMKGRTAVEIHQMFEERVSTRQFRTWRKGAQSGIVVVHGDVEQTERALEAHHHSLEIRDSP